MLVVLCMCVYLDVCCAEREIEKGNNVMRLTKSTMLVDSVRFRIHKLLLLMNGEKRRLERERESLYTRVDAFRSISSEVAR
jgi:hypothetical protein